MRRVNMPVNAANKDSAMYMVTTQMRRSHKAGTVTGAHKTTKRPFSTVALQQSGVPESRLETWIVYIELSENPGNESGGKTQVSSQTLREGRE